VLYGGKVYPTVQIGNQCWLKKNLDIGLRIEGSQQQSDNDSLEKYCYDDTPANCDTLGGLYQRGEVMQYASLPGAQGICPPGWRVPSLEDLDTLRSIVADNGSALKALGQRGGQDGSGFSGLLGGFYVGFYAGSGFSAYFWSSTGGAGAVASYLGVDHMNSIEMQTAEQLRGFSVRCLKSESPDQPHH